MRTSIGLFTSPSDWAPFPYSARCGVFSNGDRGTWDVSESRSIGAGVASGRAAEAATGPGDLYEHWGGGRVVCYRVAISRRRIPRSLRALRSMGGRYRHSCGVRPDERLRAAWFTIAGRFGTRWWWRRIGKAEACGSDLLDGAARGVHQAGSEVFQALNILLGNVIQEHVHDLVRLERVADRLTVDERGAADEPWLGGHAGHGRPSRTAREVATQSPEELLERLRWRLRSDRSAPILRDDRSNEMFPLERRG